MPKEKQSKLDSKTVKCIFIGHGVGVKGYKLWDLMVKRVLYSINVIFREVNLAPIVVQLIEDKKKLVVHLPPRIENVKPKNEQEVDDGFEKLEGSESLEEEETPPQTLRSSTQ